MINDLTPSSSIALVENLPLSRFTPSHKTLLF